MPVFLTSNFISDDAESTSKISKSEKSGQIFKTSETDQKREAVTNQSTKTATSVAKIDPVLQEAIDKLDLIWFDEPGSECGIIETSPKQLVADSTEDLDSDEGEPSSGSRASTVVCSSSLQSDKLLNALSERYEDKSVSELAFDSSSAPGSESLESEIQRERSDGKEKQILFEEQVGAEEPFSTESSTKSASESEESLISSTKCSKKLNWTCLAFYP